MQDKLDGMVLYDKPFLLSELNADCISLTNDSKHDAVAGNLLTYYLIGELYLDIEDYPKSLSWFMLGAKQNHPKCTFMIGYFYERGFYVAKDLDKAVNWYLKSMTTNYCQTIDQMDWICRYGFYSKLVTKMLVTLGQRVEKDKQKIGEFNSFYQWRLTELRERLKWLNEIIGGHINNLKVLETKFKEEELILFINEQEHIKASLVHLIEQKKNVNHDERQVLLYEKILNELVDFVYL